MFSEVREVRRVQQIISVLAKYECYQVLSMLNLRKSTKKSAKITPDAVASILEELGGTFVKLGQFLSLRPDLIPYEYAQSLEKLQENVKAFPSNKAKEIIASEIAKPLSHTFTHIDEKPLASASIGQVYRALLKSGRHVAIKVMRPGIKELMMTDILLLYRLAHHLQAHVEVFNPVEIVEEFRRYTEGELNYLSEMHNIQVFDSIYSNDKQIVIPTALPKLCSEHVLTMDFLEGRSLHAHMAHLRKAKRKELAEFLAEMVLDQVFHHGVFHADLHPGNIILMTHKRIGLLDFGIVGHIDDHDKIIMAHLLHSLVGKDLDGVVSAMKKLGMSVQLKDASLLKEDLRIVLTPLYNAESQNIDIAQLFLSCMHVAREHKLTVPRNLVLLGKSVVTMKGLVDELDPEFNLTKKLQDFVQQEISSSLSLSSVSSQAKKNLFEATQFVAKIPEYGEEYLDSAKHVEENLSVISKEVGELSSQMRIATKEFFIVLLILMFVAAGAFLWDKGPIISGIPAISSAFFIVSALLFIRVIKLL